MGYAETSKSTQAEYEKNVKNYNSAQQDLKNQRKKEQEIKDAANKVITLQGYIKKLEDTIIAPAKANIKTAEDQMAPYWVTYNSTYAANPNDPNLVLIQGYIAPFQKKVADNQKIIKDTTATIEKYRQEIKSLSPNYSVKKSRVIPPKATKNAPGSNQNPQKKFKFSKDYKYNAPMVSTAYFQESSIINTVLDGKLVDQGKFEDARQAWQGTTGGRGTIQMDQKFLSTFSANSFDKKQIKKLDLQKYGFKFLYNPQTVSMAWGLMQQMDPVYEATQYDPFQVVSAGLMTSTVRFELLLNRIKDFDYLGSNGLLSSGKNPYPESIDPADQIEIWNKGTMYDLEYFFKTVNGPDGTFTSMLNGTTADKAYMRPTIVELHLGNKMRYRVRISDFAVNHVIFNNRMVPMLTTVSMTCNRFIDGPQWPPNLPGKNTNPSNPSATTSPNLGSRPAGIRGPIR